MNTYRKNAITVGVLFLLGFAGVFSPVFLRPLLDSPNYLIKLAENKSLVLMSAFFSLIMAFACSGIAIGLYPVLKKHNESLSLGAVGFRIIENVFAIVAVLGLLALLTLSQEYVKAGAPAVSNFQTLGSLLLGVRIWASQLLSQIGFGLGALMYYYVFYRSKLIPRWLSGWGVIAIILHLSSVFITIIGQIDAFSMTPLILLSMPIFIQELVLAGWLIVKGFNPSAIASGSSKVD
jgi:Domain of unknown function (DUF4386)